MTTQYTNNFRLNKPDFRSTPWSAQLNENTDRLDTLIYNLFQANNIGSYENDAEVEAGQIVYDTDLDTFWLCRVSHTTKATGTFQDERDENPAYWTPVQFGLNPRGQWQQDTAYGYYDLAYDANENVAGICLVPHVSPSVGTMRDEADKWVFIIDIQSGGSIGATDIVFDDTDVPFTAANVQIALEETNVRIDNAATIVSGILSDVSDLQTDVSTNTADIATNTADIATNTGDIASNTAAIATKAANSEDYLVKTASGGLSAERVVTDTVNLTWDWATAGQAKANVVFASQAEAEAGSINTKSMTPLRTAQAIAALASASGVLMDVSILTSSQTVTVQGTKALVILWGGSGGGGGQNNATTRGFPGAGGGALRKYLSGLTIGANLTLTVGAAGSAGTTTVNAGNGGNSSLASGTETISTLTANGGGGGKSNQSINTLDYPSGGTASGGDLNMTGQQGTVSPGDVNGAVPDVDGGLAGFGMGRGGRGRATSGANNGYAGDAGGCIIMWFK